MTGGGAGIGQATVLRAAREGTKVVVVYRSEGGRVQTEKMLKDQKAEGIFVQGDVRQEADWIRILKMSADMYGRLDTLFSNAGGNLIKPITEVGVEKCDNLFALNVRGSFWVPSMLSP